MSPSIARWLTARLRDPGRRSAVAGASLASNVTAHGEPRSGRVKPLTLVKLIVAVGLLAFVLSRAGVEALLQTLREAEWQWVLLAIGSASVAMVINVARWQLMLRGQGAQAP